MSRLSGFDLITSETGFNLCHTLGECDFKKKGSRVEGENIDQNQSFLSAQPDRQNKCELSTFIQKPRYVKNFFLMSQLYICLTLVRFMHQNHMVRARETSWFGSKSLFSSPRSQNEMVWFTQKKRKISPGVLQKKQKNTWFSCHKKCLHLSLTISSGVNQAVCSCLAVVTIK